MPSPRLFVLILIKWSRAWDGNREPLEVMSLEECEITMGWLRSDHIKILSPSPKCVIGQKEGVLIVRGQNYC